MADDFATWASKQKNAAAEGGTKGSKFAAWAEANKPEEAPPPKPGIVDRAVTAAKTGLSSIDWAGQPPTERPGEPRRGSLRGAAPFVGGDAPTGPAGGGRGVVNPPMVNEGRREGESVLDMAGRPPAFDAPTAERDYDTDSVAPREQEVRAERFLYLQGNPRDSMREAAPASETADFLRSFDRKPLDQSLGGAALEVAGDAARGVVKAGPGLASAAYGGIEAGADIFGAPKVADWAAQSAGAGRDYLRQFDNPNGDHLVTGAFQSLASAAMGGAAGGAPGAIGLAVGQTAGDKYSELRAAKVPVADAVEGATVHGLAEYAGERTGMKSLGRLVEGIARQTGMRPLEAFKEALIQQGEEQATLAIQTIYDKFGSGSLRNNLTLDEYLQDAVSTAAQTAIMSAAAGGGGMVARSGTRAAAPSQPQAPQQSPYELARSKGFMVEPPLTTDTPIAQRSKTAAVFENLASLHGIPAAAVARAKQVADTLPLGEVGGFYQRFVSSLQKRGLAPADIDPDVLGTVAAGPIEPPPEAKPGKTEAPADTGAIDAAELLGTPTEFAQTPELAPDRKPAIDEAAHQAATSPENDLPEPTDAQKDAGNYRLGHTRVSGFDVSIENPKGSTRRSKAADPNPWEVTMPVHYGYIKGTTGADGDHVDLSIGDKGDNGRFWVINQNHPDGTFDEHKVFTGVDSAEEALDLYHASFADDFGEKVFGSITEEMDPGTLKAALPGMSKPAPVLTQPTGATNDPQDSAGLAGSTRSSEGPDSGPGTRDPGAPGLARSDAPGRTAAAVPAGPQGGDQPNARVVAGAGGGGRVIARAGRTPNAAQPIELRTNKDGTVTPFMEGHEMLDFDSGKPIKLPADVSDMDAKKAIRAAGAVTSKVNFFPAEKGKSQAQDDLKAGLAELAGVLKPSASAPAPQSVVKKPSKARKVAPVRGSQALGAISARLGGLSPDLLADLSSKVERTRVNKKTGKKTAYVTPDNPPHAGHGPLFRKGGTADMSEVARVLEEEGFIEPGLLERDPLAATQRADEIVRGELNKGGSTLREGNADAIEAEMQRRAEDAMGTPDDIFDVLTDEDLAESGYTAMPPELKAETERLLALAEAEGIDTEALREDAARLTEGQPDDVYHAQAQRLAQEALAAARPGPAEADPGPAKASGRNDGQAAGRQGSEPEQAREGLTLEAPTKAQVLAQQAALEREQADKDAPADKPASKLTGEQPDMFNTQASVFDAPEEPAAKAEKDKALDDLNDALGDLANLFGKNFKASMVPEQEQKLMPVLTRVMDAAFRAGYYTFKEAARFVLDTIRAKLGADVADAITLDHLQGAYIGMAGKYKDQGASSKKDVVAVEDLAELAAADNQGSQEKRDVPSTPSRVERDRSQPAAAAPAVEAPVRVAERATAVRTGTPGEGARGERSGRADNQGVHDGVPTVVGERGDQLAPGGNRVDKPALVPAGADLDQRGGGYGDPGVPVETVATDLLGEVAEDGLRDGAKRKAQRLAESTPVKVGDLANIKATLPYLLDGQQEDVHKGEKRFAEPEGYGMLYTNGTGTGKTFTGLGLVKRFARRGKSNIVIVAPSDKIIEDWIDSGKALGLTITRLNDVNDAGKGIVITTYANFGANTALADRAWDLVVHDEAHYLTQDKDGSMTNALQTLRAITLHPDGYFRRADMLNPELAAKIADLSEREKNARTEDGDTPLSRSIADKLTPLYRKMEAEREKVKAFVQSHQGAERPRVAFLSATPFAYEKTVNWANGYLFDYGEGKEGQDLASGSGAGHGYNSGDWRDQFFMQHFGYRMRYNKLTEPDAKVDRGLMQRQFNGWLKKRGALSGRMLDVKADYDRRFITVQSAIGERIDAALQWLWDQSGPKNPGMSKLRKTIDDSFDYLSRRYLLEAIKATEVIPHVKEHLAMGRKVVVFHDYKKGGGFNPFNLDGQSLDEGADDAYAAFRSEFRDLVEAPLGRMPSPIQVFTREFPNVLLFNGDVPSKQRRENVAKFQDDGSGPQVILVQSAAGKEGISLHDTTGKHQRALFNLGQPTQPTTAIQQEGRIYRTGQVTDAIFRYLNTGTNWERWAFATTIANRASAAENLGMGELARALKDAFVMSFEESGDYRAGMEGEGTGGKERDKDANNALTEYDRARAFYFGTQKKNSRTKAQEGKDYFATPEPVGLKMVQWADGRGGEAGLEPSAGHGAIARWLPETMQRRAIEPSQALSARLAMVFDGEVVRSTFEDHNTINKYDVIVMNPPFGTAGRTAVDHMAKAATHLRDGGRMVALIPTGPAADAKFEKWFYEEATKPAKPLLDMPKFGPVYKGDKLVLQGYDLAKNGSALVVGKSEGREGYVVGKFSDGTTMVIGDSIIKSIEPSGKRTESYKPGENLHLVADIKMPQVTFERAGTAVSTRIVVIDKLAKDQPAPNQVNRDYSSIDDIGELFDKLEHSEVPKRTKPVEEEAEPEPAKPARVAKAEAKAAAAEEGAKVAASTGMEIVTVTTNSGKELRGVLRTDLTKAQAQSIDAFTWKPKGKEGFFIREKHLPELIKKFPPIGDVKFSIDESRRAQFSRDKAVASLPKAVREDPFFGTENPAYRDVHARGALWEELHRFEQQRGLPAFSVGVDSIGNITVGERLKGSQYEALKGFADEKGLGIYVMQRAAQQGNDTINQMKALGFTPVDGLGVYAPGRSSSTTTRPGFATFAYKPRGISEFMFSAAQSVADTEAAGKFDKAAGQNDTSTFRFSSNRNHVNVAARFQQAIAAGAPSFVLQAVEAPGHRPELRAAAAVARGIAGHDVIYVRQPNGRIFNGITSDGLSANYALIDVDSPRPVMAVLGHELLHRLVATRPDLYSKLNARIERVLKNESEYGRKLNERYVKLNLETLDAKALREEIIADVFGDEWADPDFWRELASDRAPGFKAIVAELLKHLDNLIQKITRMRPFGTDEYLSDLKEARAAVIEATREFSAGEVGALADVPAGLKLSVASADAPRAGSLKPSSAPLDKALQLAGGNLAARLTSPAYTKLLDVLDRGATRYIGQPYLYAKAGLVADHGLTPEYIDARSDMRTGIRKGTREAATVIEQLQSLTRAEARVAYLWMQEKPDTATEKELMAAMPEESRALLQDLKKRVDDLGQEAVKYGLMSPETYERNAMAYLHRSYQKYETSDAAAKTARVKAVRILGDQFKGRGLRDDVAMQSIGSADWWARQEQGPDTSLKGKKFNRLELRALPDTATADLIEGGGGKKLGKLRQVVYWPAGEKIPSQYADWRNDGEWEARFFDKSGKVGMWRDFTLPERTAMGEIQEVRYSAAKTLLQATRDVETAKLLDWVARKQGTLHPDQIPDGHTIVAASEKLGRSYLPHEWVQVPEATIPGTAGLKRYGNLAGRYIPGPTWNDLRQISSLSDQGDIGKLWGKVLTAWKISKTALSPATHMNNVLSNFVLADAHDIQAGQVLRALKAWNGYRKGEPAAKKLIADYQDNGGDGGKFNEGELREDVMGELLAQLERDINEQDGATALVSAAQVVDLIKHREFRQAYAAIGQTKTAGKVALPFKKMVQLYGVEDEFFRLAAFIKARDDGLSDREAGKFAQDSFLNYNINAPWIQAARRTFFPFISFTYRAAPMLARTFADKPHKLAKYALVAGALNAIAYSMLGGDGDEEKERALLPDEKAGKIWGIFPKLMRMPWNDEHGSPVFLDVRRWIPGGDIAETGSNHAAVPIPAPLLPGGPLVILGELVANKTLFTGKEVTKATDTLAEKYGKTSEYLWKSTMPNLPGLPGTYSTDALIGAGSGKTDVFGREQSLGQAALSSVGVKLASYPADVLVRNAALEAKGKINEIRNGMRADARQAARKGMTEEELEERQAKAIEKIEAVSKELEAKTGRARGEPVEAE